MSNKVKPYILPFQVIYIFIINAEQPHHELHSIHFNLNVES